MKTPFLKTTLWSFCLIITCMFFTSSATPGFDANGDDIDECALYAPCPEGYVCRNIIGSYICEGNEEEVPELSTNFTMDETSAGALYNVRGKCNGLGWCEVVCKTCLRSYSAHRFGRAYYVSGFCVCGSIAFDSLPKE